MLFTRETAAEFGRRGGERSTQRKRHAAFLNGLKGGRPRVSHQAKIRAKLAALEPRPQIPNLVGCTVEAISLDEARSVIEKYEWLGTMGTGGAHYGLLSPTRELLGVASFGLPPRTPTIPGTQEICLERGACVHFAPRNAASFLIRRAVKLAHRDHGWNVFVAFADPDANELGTVYQASNWHYLGRARTHGLTRIEFRHPGSDRWHSDRLLAVHGFTGPGAYARARAAGWASRTRPAKHKYVWIEGPRAKALRAQIPLKGVLPYPKQRGI